MKITAGDYDKTDGDERVAHWLVDEFRKGPVQGLVVVRNGNHEDIEHLRACQELDVEFEGYTGSYNCDTGCEMGKFEASITCPHWAPIRPAVEVEYGEFGDLPDLMEKIFG